MAIRLIVGPPGTGKTYTLVSSMIAEFRQNQPQVMANMVGLRCPEAMYIEAAADFENLASGLVALDEVGIFFGSRTWQKRTERQIAAFAQVRKDGLDLWCTTQHENRADAILRENCSEIWRMRRLGPVFMAQIIDPHSDDVKARKIGRRWFPLRPEIYRLYDTAEKVDELGRGGGFANSAQALSVVARRRAAASTRAAEAAQRKRLLKETIYRPGRGNRQLTVEAEQVQAWLISERWGIAGVCDSLPPGEVLAEVRRRRWLKTWGLTHDDVPHDCSFLQPWLKGYDPASVSRRSEEQAEIDAARDLVDASRRRSRRES